MPSSPRKRLFPSPALVSSPDRVQTARIVTTLEHVARSADRVQNAFIEVLP
jgi:hypothetical protein